MWASVGSASGRRADLSEVQIGEMGHAEGTPQTWCEQHAAKNEGSVMPETVALAVLRRLTMLDTDGGA